MIGCRIAQSCRECRTDRLLPQARRCSRLDRRMRIVISIKLTNIQFPWTRIEPQVSGLVVLPITPLPRCTEIGITHTGIPDAPRLPVDRTFGYAYKLHGGALNRSGRKELRPAGVYRVWPVCMGTFTILQESCHATSGGRISSHSGRPASSAKPISSISADTRRPTASIPAGLGEVGLPSEMPLPAAIPVQTRHGASDAMCRPAQPAAGNPQLPAMRTRSPPRPCQRW